RAWSVTGVQTCALPISRRKPALGRVMQEHPVPGPDAEVLHRLHETLGPSLLTRGVEAAPVPQPAELRAELDRDPGGLVAEAEVRNELVDGHEARGGSSTCVTVRRPWTSPCPSTRPWGTSRRPGSAATGTQSPGRSRPAACRWSG